ncbi:hypothetical protein OEB99_05470 [Actinotalea sp. M2MS4P-6]|uniref:hypothetical protein n=1 Tax=Actinotalea sp. M2MS4P-6 TaxID=2983762 RepID=UPI0021E3BF33|nr:hypothetical protein [Actinotalea sp. M2MS4P-6]MCV2393752.1 hypothetical protein [Actinotalea sp. M2MS4P-6]
MSTKTANAATAKGSTAEPTGTTPTAAEPSRASVPAGAAPSGSAPAGATTSTTAPQPATPLPPATPRPPAVDATPVTSWLTDRFASAFAEAFFEQGYLDVADVDEAAIDHLVTEKGTANRLKADLARRAEPMVPPDLPPGTALDLSKPQVTSADGVTFTVPTALSVSRSSDAIQSPMALQNSDWVVIARNAALLYGFRMDGPAPVRARRSVLEWVVPERIDFARSEMFQARVESAVTYTEDTASYVRAGFDKETATAGYAFCSASFERSRKERTASTSAHRELHEVGMWKYPRATLFLDDCTRVSDAFVQAIDHALATDLDTGAGLEQVLAEYGHAVPMEVTLGGQLHFEHVRTEDTTTSERQVEQEIKAAVEVKYLGASASAGYATGSSTSRSGSALELAEQTTFDGLGGDTTLVSNPADWAPTVRDPRLWAVIGNARLISTIDLLDDERRSAVLARWSAPAYPELPAIGEPLTLQPDTASRSTTAGFLLGLRDCDAMPQQGLVLVASGSQERDADSADEASAGAGVYSHHGGDVWYDVNSVCLPIAKGMDFGVWTADVAQKGGSARSRLGFARTQFGFGDWTQLPVGEPAEVTLDGFLAVGVALAERVAGEVMVWVDGKPVAATSAHRDQRYGSPAPFSAICIPAHAGTTVEVRPSFGKAPAEAAKVQARFIPLDDAWILGPPREVEPVTHLVADTDGVLHAQLDVVGDGPRAVVRLYAEAPDPWAGCSVHVYTPHVRLLRHASALLPIGKGGKFFSSYAPTSGAPVLALTWTPILRRPASAQAKG